MVEMGDMREGIMPGDLEAVAREVLKTPGIALKGIGANFACLGGLVPDAGAMAQLSTLADKLEREFGPFLVTISGGNSASLPWALGRQSTGRINNLRLGEAILLGVDPVSGKHIDGLYTDAFTLVAEVIETKLKPGKMPLSVYDLTNAKLRIISTNKETARSLLAVGLQDIDVAGLTPPEGTTIIGATSDHLVMKTSASPLSLGSEIRFKMNYSALMRAMSAPDVEKDMQDLKLSLNSGKASDVRPRLSLV